MEDNRSEIFSLIDEVFVGRKGELNQLHSYLEEALKGTPQICFVSGEVGTAVCVKYFETNRQKKLL